MNKNHLKAIMVGIAIYTAYQFHQHTQNGQWKDDAVGKVVNSFPFGYFGAITFGIIAFYVFA